MIRWPPHWLCGLIGHKVRERPAFNGHRWAKRWCARCSNYPCERRFYPSPWDSR